MHTILNHSRTIKLSYPYCAKYYTIKQMHNRDIKLFSCGLIVLSTIPTCFSTIYCCPYSSWKFLIFNITTTLLTNWCVQPSIIWQRIRLWAWFFQCSMSVHPDMCLFTNCSMYYTTPLCSPLCSSSFCWQHEVSICNSMIWLPTGFVMPFAHSQNWIHCRDVCCTVLRVTLCNERSITTNKV